jgi:hypothetical protein
MSGIENTRDTAATIMTETKRGASGVLWSIARITRSGRLWRIGHLPGPPLFSGPHGH